MLADCGEVTEPENGYVFTNGTSMNDTMNLICIDGHDLHGEDLVTCQDTGNWSNTLGQCVKKG